MFCSNCGKSVRPEDASCPHCGAVLGEDRFLGNMYTSSQVRLPVDALDRAPAGSLSAYTRTDYMSYDNQPEDDVYSNTTYRPLLDDEEDLTRREQEEAALEQEPEDVPAEDEFEPEAGPEAEPEAEPEPEEEPVDDGYDARPADSFVPESDEDDGETSVSPLPEIKPRGISPAVQRYMREAEERHQAQRGGGGLKLRLPFRKKQPEPEAGYEEEPAEDIPGAEAAEPAEPAEQTAREQEAAYEEEPAYDGTEAEDAEPAAADSEETGEPDGYEDDGYEEEVEGDGTDDAYDEEEDDGSPKFKLDLSALKNNRKLQIGIAAVLVLAILIGGVRWLLYVTSSLGTKIAGVTHSTYSDGIKLISDFTTDEYRSNLVNTGSVNMSYAQQQMNEDMNKLNALMPETPQENDQLFVTALTIVHQGVQNVIKSDAEAIYNGKQAEREPASQQEWAVIQNAVSRLKEATTVTELSALAGDVQNAVMPQPTPTPTPPAPTATPEPQPQTLKEGIKNSAEVKRMQTRLIELGFLAKGADGDFGPKTTAALKAFQEAAGLTADGVATQEVLDALYDENAPTASGATESTLRVETV